MSQIEEYRIIEEEQVASIHYPRKVKRMIRRTQRGYSDHRTNFDYQLFYFLSILKAAEDSEEDLALGQEIISHNRRLSRKESDIARFEVNYFNAKLQRVIKREKFGAGKKFYVAPIYSRVFNGLSSPIGDNLDEWILEVNYSDSRNLLFFYELFAIMVDSRDEFDEKENSWQIIFRIRDLEEGKIILSEHPQLQECYNEIIGHCFLGWKNAPQMTKYLDSLATFHFPSIMVGTKGASEFVLCHEAAHAILEHHGPRPFHGKMRKLNLSEPVRILDEKKINMSVYYDN